jgi:hypothetical protein
MGPQEGVESDNSGKDSLIVIRSPVIIMQPAGAHEAASGRCMRVHRVQHAQSQHTATRGGGNEARPTRTEPGTVGSWRKTAAAEPSDQ